MLLLMCRWLWLLKQTHSLTLLRCTTDVLFSGLEASALENALQVPVLRHRDKKPGGAAGDLERHFGWGTLLTNLLGPRDSGCSPTPFLVWYPGSHWVLH
jgi:hypothetical protein